MSLTAFVVISGTPPSGHEVHAASAPLKAFLEHLAQSKAKRVEFGICGNAATYWQSSVYDDDREMAIQQITNPDGSTSAIVFDGWLENRDELIAALREQGASELSNDGMLCLIGWSVWGETLANKLYGEYSFVCHKTGTKEKKPELFAVRDKVGVRPLFYSQWKAGIAISNFPGALSVIPWVGSEINEGYAAEFLCAEINSVSETHFVGVRRLLGGHLLRVVRPSAPMIQRYWLSSARVDRRPHDEIRADFRRVLNLATISACRVARPSTLMVSGGIDSSCLAVVIADAIDEGKLSHDQFFASNLTYPGLACDESQFREALADVLPYKIKVFTPRYATSAEITARTARLRYPFGTFPGSSGDVVAEHLVQLSGRVIITGEGGDELFLPVATAFSSAWTNLDDAKSAIRLLKNRWSTRSRSASLLGKIRHAIDPILMWRTQNTLSRFWERKRNGWQSAVDAKWANRVGLVNRLDRLVPSAYARTRQAAYASSGLSSSIAETAYAMNFLRKTEARNPLLSARVVGFCNTLPLALLDGQTQGVSRQLLRAVVALRLPEVIVNRTGKAEFSESVLPALERVAAERFGPRWREPNLAPNRTSTLVANQSRYVWRLDALHSWAVFAEVCKH